LNTVDIAFLKYYTRSAGKSGMPETLEDPGIMPKLRLTISKAQEKDA